VLVVAHKIHHSSLRRDAVPCARSTESTDCGIHTATSSRGDMSPLQGLFAAVAAVVLFLYGLQGFSHELQVIGETALQSWLGRVTASRWLGFVTGALTTAVVQSSSAVTALTAALVDSGVISFGASLAVVLGSNVGTTATAWLVSFKLTGIGPFFLVLGAGRVGRSDSSAGDRQSRVFRRSRPRRRLGPPRLQLDDRHRVSRVAGSDRASSETVVVS
jgi:hypothetical protein